MGKKRGKKRGKALVIMSGGEILDVDIEIDEVTESEDGGFAWRACYRLKGEIITDGGQDFAWIFWMLLMT